MSMKFRRYCMCAYVCARACFKGTFIIKFHFLCRQTLLPASWQTSGNGGAGVCASVCVFILATPGSHWDALALGLVFIFILVCLLQLKRADRKMIFISDLSLIQKLWRSPVMQGKHRTCTHTHKDARVCTRPQIDRSVIGKAIRVRGGILD